MLQQCVKTIYQNISEVIGYMSLTTWLLNKKGYFVLFTNVKYTTSKLYDTVSIII